MANLKEIRNRITSVSSTMQITAMKMVSAAKLKHKMRSHNAPYAEKLTELCKIFLPLKGDAGGDIPHNVILKVLLVVVTSNRGLAGAFNTNAIKKLKTVLSFMQENK
jgi:F-type H+-transporting ATPase subunit gamma